MITSPLDPETRAEFARADLAEEGGMCLQCGASLPHAEPDDAALCWACAVDDQAYHDTKGREQ